MSQPALRKERGAEKNEENAKKNTYVRVHTHERMTYARTYDCKAPCISACVCLPFVLYLCYAWPANAC